MIRIELDVLLAVLLTMPIFVVFFLALFYTSDRTGNIADQFTSVHQCPYCAVVFRRNNEALVITCPQCKSIIEIEEGDGNGAE